MLNNLITSMLQEAFSGMLKDTYTPFVLTRTTHVVDKLTDQNITSTETFSGSGVFGKFETADIDGTTILRTDISLFILQAEFATKPLIGDMIGHLTVAQVMKDPADVGYTLALRGYNGLES